MRGLVVSALLKGLILAEAHAASFDCNGAHSWAEKAICSSQQLSDMDDQLHISYKKALASAPTPDTVKSEQRDWLVHTRDACTNVECLKAAYQTRLMELRKMVSTSTGLPNLLGGYERYVHGHPDPDSADLTITRRNNGQYHLSGSASSGADSPGGPNVGDIEGDFVLSGNRAQFSSGDCSMSMAFSPWVVTVSGYHGDCAGMNVSWDGEYRRTSASDRTSVQQGGQRQQQPGQRVQQQNQPQEWQPSEAEKQLLHPNISKQDAQASLKKARGACQYAMINLKAADLALKQYAIVVQFDKSMMSDDDWQCYKFSMQRAL